MPESLDVCLQELGATACELLAPHIGVRAYVPPRVRLRGKNVYYPRSNTIYYYPEDILNCSDQMIGHEATHVLYQFLNPDVSDRYDTSLDAANLAELVAVYGGLVLHRKRNKRIRELKTRIKQALTPYPVRKRTRIPAKESVHDYEVHEGGSRAAEYLFREYGDKHLPLFAGAHEERAKRALKRLGYRDPLVIRIDDAEEKE